MIKKCIVCGKEFTPYPGAELIQKYCSKQCRRNFAKKPKELRDMVDPAGIFVDMCINQPNDTVPRKLTTATCLHCRGQFKQTFPNEKFCSDECRLKYFHSNPLWHAI